MAHHIMEMQEIQRKVPSVPLISLSPPISSLNTSMAHDVMEMQETQHEVPSIPLLLSFCRLSYSVNMASYCSYHLLWKVTSAVTRGAFSNFSSDTKVLLNDISGEAKGGEILAVLGHSGSGKTTFLDALANRISKGCLKGDVSFNGEQLESQKLKSISSYVMQNDVLYPMLTVEETLMFAAAFQLPQTLSKMEKRQRVLDLIHQLGLENATKTIIGDEGHRGVSGGERRRVSIGIELISQPNILFLDEPTSGLDSSSAYIIVKILQRIARSGSIVIMSIHQPSYRILGMIDHVLLLSYGQMVYSGSAKDITSFFADSGHPIPGNVNWAEFALDLIQELHNSPDGIHELVEFHKSWLNSESSRKLSPSIEVMPRTSFMPTFANPFWKEVVLLSTRSFTISRRTPEEFATLFMMATLTGVLFAAAFWHLNNSPKGIMKRMAFFFSILCAIFNSCSQVLPTLLLERYIIIRETTSMKYRRSSYVVSHALVTIPSLAIVSLAFAAITFWTVRLGGGPSGFFFYVLIIISSYWAGSSFGTFLSGIIRGPVGGFILFIGSLSIFLLFSGFFVTRNQIPGFMRLFHYLSLIKYPYQALLQNEFHDPQKCFSTGVQIFDYTLLSSVPITLKEKALQTISSMFGMNFTGNTCLTTGVDVLQQQEVTDLSKWSCIFIIVAYGLFFRILFYFSLLLVNKNKRS